jgi:hypothetical protein
MLACQVEGFVKTVCGEIEFTGISPVKIQQQLSYKFLIGRSLKWLKQKNA